MAESDQRPIGTGFGAKTEPDEVLAGIDLTGRVAVVTGGYSGIGLETTRALAGAGARVWVPVRNPEKATEALTEIKREAGGEVVAGPMDLADLDSVRRFAAVVRRNEEKLDLLVNNAGVMACPETRVGPGWELQFAVNHLGHFVLTTELLPLLEEAGARDDGGAAGPGRAARVVALSSTGHKRSGIRWDDIHFQRDPYDKWAAYGQSKTADALFALGLDLRMRVRGVRAYSVHPGGIMTPLQRHLDTEEMSALGWLDEDGNLSEAVKARFKTPTQGASTTLWAATSPALEERGGVYCADCDISRMATEADPYYVGVASYAVDDEAALRLWDVTEEMLAGAAS